MYTGKGSSVTLEGSSTDSALTNKRQQKASAHYGKYYQGNSVSLQDIQKELPEGRLSETTLPQMCEIVKHTHRSLSMHHSRQGVVMQHNTTVLWCGYDFIVDKGGKAFLLEVNVKPYERFLSDSEASFPLPVARSMVQQAVPGFFEIIREELNCGEKIPEVASIDELKKVEIWFEEGYKWVRLQ